MAGISKDERRALLRAIKDADENFKKGMYALAEPVYRKGVEHLGDGSPEISGCLRNLAQICAERTDYGEALKLNIHGLLLSEERFGEDHPKTIALMDEIAGLYEKLGRKDESRDMYERARKASERSLWADQVNEPVEGVADSDAEDLELDYQYTETAKLALDGLPEPGEIPGYVFGQPVQPKKKELSEETMKLPRVEDPPKPPRDDQLDTLILDRIKTPKDDQLDTLILTRPKATPADKAGVKSATDTNASAELKPDSKAIAESTPAAEKAKTESSAPEPVSSASAAVSSDPAPISPAPEPVSPTSEAVKSTPELVSPTPEAAPSTPKAVSPTAKLISFAPKVPPVPPAVTESGETDLKEPDLEIPKIVLGGSLKQEAKEKATPNPIANVVTKSTLQERLEFEQQAAARAIELASQRRTGIEAKLFKSDKQRNIVLGSLLGWFLILLLASVLLKHGTTKEEYRTLPHRYRTADGEKLFFLPSASECEFVAGPETARMPYFQHHGGILDSFRIMFGPLIHHQYWLTRTKNGIVDDQGSTLYIEGSPELQVADYVEDLGRAAQLTYLRQHHYPKSADELDSAKRAFRNPFSGQVEKPSIQSIVLGKRSAPADGQRKRLYDIAINGGRWPHEPKRHAGEISGYSAVIHSKKGDLNTFYGRGYDRDARPLSGSQPGTTYAVILENGAIKPSPRPHLGFTGKTFWRPRRAWLIDDTNASVLFILKYGAAILFTLIAAVAWIISRNKRKKKGMVMKAVLWSSTILALLYILAEVIP